MYRFKLFETLLPVLAYQDDSAESKDLQQLKTEFIESGEAGSIQREGKFLKTYLQSGLFIQYPLLGQVMEVFDCACDTEFNPRIYTLQNFITTGVQDYWSNLINKPDAQVTFLDTAFKDYKVDSLTSFVEARAITAQASVALGLVAKIENELEEQQSEGVRARQLPVTKCHLQAIQQQLILKQISLLAREVCTPPPNIDSKIFVKRVKRLILQSQEVFGLDEKSVSEILENAASTKLDITLKNYVAYLTKHFLTAIEQAKDKQKLVGRTITAHNVTPTPTASALPKVRTYSQALQQLQWVSTHLLPLYRQLEEQEEKRFDVVPETKELNVQVAGLETNIRKVLAEEKRTLSQDQLNKIAELYEALGKVVCTPNYNEIRTGLIEDLKNDAKECKNDAEFQSLFRERLNGKKITDPTAAQQIIMDVLDLKDEEAVTTYLHVQKTQAFADENSQCLAFLKKLIKEKASCSTYTQFQQNLRRRLSPEHAILLACPENVIANVFHPYDYKNTALSGWQKYFGFRLALVGVIVALIF